MDTYRNAGWIHIDSRKDVTQVFREREEGSGTPITKRITQQNETLGILRKNLLSIGLLTILLVCVLFYLLYFIELDPFFYF